MSKTKENTRKYAEKMLDRLVEIDAKTMEAYYDMGSILSSLAHGKLYDVLGYRSMTHLVEEELTYSPGTASTYMRMFSHFKRLHYTKDEALKLLKKFGLSHMCEVLPSIKTKIGQRAIKARIDAINAHQINFTLTDVQLDEAHRALKAAGAIQKDSGRWEHSSEAFMEMVALTLKNYPKLKKVS